MKRNYYKSIVNVLLQLHKDHPSYDLGKHLSIALSEYTDLFNVPDKEFLSLLKKYQAEIAQEQDITDAYIDQIISDASDLSHILDENEDD